MNNHQIENQICTLNFYLNRSSDIKNEQMYVYIDNLFYSITKNVNENTHTYLHTLYKMLFQTRDCLFGRGEKQISYLFICVFYKYFYKHAIHALYSFCTYYGSWADIKYFCRFVKDFKYLTENIKNELTSLAIDMMIYQFDIDYTHWNHSLNSYLERKTLSTRPYAPDYITLVAKWIPRESSSFQWLFEKIVERYYYIHCPHFFHESSDIKMNTKKWNEMKMNFRKKVISLSKELEVPQRYMCSKRPEELTSQNVSLQTCIRQSKYLSKTNENNQQVCPEFCEYIDNEDVYINTHSKKNINISLDMLVKKGFNLINSVYNNNTERQMRIINNTWTKIVKNMNFSLSVIPIVDLSGPQKYNAIGLGVLMAQISTYKKMIIVENDFQIINISENQSFIDILRTFFEYKCIFFNISYTLSCLFKQHNMSYIDPMSYVVLSSESNIIKNQESVYNLYDKNVFVVFWNVLNSDDIIRNLYFDKFWYMSGTTPNLLYNLKNEKSNKDLNKLHQKFNILNNSLSKYEFTHQYHFEIKNNLITHFL